MTVTVLNVLLYILANTRDFGTNGIGGQPMLRQARAHLRAYAQDIGNDGG